MAAIVIALLIIAVLRPRQLGANRDRYRRELSFLDVLTPKRCKTMIEETEVLLTEDDRDSGFLQTVEQTGIAV